MAFLRSTRGRYGRAAPDSLRGSGAGQVEERRATRSNRLCSGTLACARCDAPISVGDEPLSLADQLICPFCQNRGPVRDFLSLAPPTRPARVEIRVRLPATPSGPR
jgi:hypothetical protein